MRVVTDFASLADAGRQLGLALRARTGGWSRPTLAPVLPNGVPVAIGIRQEVDLPWVPVPVRRTAVGVEVVDPGALAGCTAIVVDDGVETGTVARAVGPALREGGAARLVLAVPVCSHGAMADLTRLYDDVVCIVTPAGRRSLASHFAVFDTVDEAEARRLLDQHPS